MIVNALPKLCGLSLQDLLPAARRQAVEDVQFTSCTSDSRQCRPGDLFIAMVGATHDGHDFIDEAVRNGASGIVAERYVAADGVPVVTVPDSRIAYGELCHALAGRPSQRLDVVGVTGTNGKTTTSCLIHSVLRAGGHVAGIMGTLGYCDGRKTLPAPLTTPSAAAIADYLARMRGNGCGHAVIELSSHALAQHRTAGLELDIACVTNVRRDHLDYHRTVKNYHNIKARIFDLLQGDGVSVLNLDDPASEALIDRAPGPLMTIGMRGPAEVRGTLLDRSCSEQTFLLECGNESYPVRTHVIGDHHIYNCLMAAAVGLIKNIDLPTIVRALEFVDEVPGRLQRIECGQPFSVFVDYAHTADALRGSLQTVRETTEGRVICVFGAGGDRDRSKRPLMGREVQQWADRAIITDDNPRGESSQKIIREILNGMEDSFDAVVHPDRAGAIELALASAEPGDVVLIAGKGHETTQEIAGRRIYFDDREVVRSWFRSNPSDAALKVWRPAA